MSVSKLLNWSWKSGHTVRCYLIVSEPCDGRQTSRKVYLRELDPYLGRYTIGARFKRVSCRLSEILVLQERKAAPGKYL